MTMKTGERFERLIELMARLRAPEGCPWDQEQTLDSLRPFILEEAYELVDAIDGSQPEAIKEELGDLVLEVLFVSQICAEREHFELWQVLELLEEKLVRRHPHVFGPRQARDSGEALARWNEIKDTEKSKGESVLSNVPRALPALVRASKLSAKAARTGFDWKSVDDVVEKLREELTELEMARVTSRPEAIAEEIGDLLFVVVNLARHLGVDPELALNGTNQKFVNRFRHVEKRLAADKRSPSESNLEEMEALWQEAKKTKP
jgi:MazG family protein